MAGEDREVRRRCAYLWVPVALAAYVVLYMTGWSLVSRVPSTERDGMAWGLLFRLTLPWSPFSRPVGVVALHAGAVINAVVIAGLVGRRHPCCRQGQL